MKRYSLILCLFLEDEVLFIVEYCLNAASII